MSYQSNIFILLFLCFIIGCKENTKNISPPLDAAEKPAKEIIALIGVSKTSGMANPNTMEYHDNLIIEVDSIYRIRSGNTNLGEGLNDTLYRKRNDIGGKNLFDLVPRNDMKNKTIGAFGVNDGQDWLIAIEFKNADFVVWKMASSGLPKEFEDLNNALAELW